MAPKRGKPDGSVKPSNATFTSSPRVTRSSTLRATRTSAADSSTPMVALPREPPKKKLKKSSKAEKPKSETKDSPNTVQFSKTVVIEHCKQCNSFKVRAAQVKNGLEIGVPGIKVLVNPEKPRRGCFEIREEGGETFITLLDLKRPFKELKALDMDKVTSDIVEKIK